MKPLSLIIEPSGNDGNKDNHLLADLRYEHNNTFNSIEYSINTFHCTAQSTVASITSHGNGVS